MTSLSLKNGLLRLLPRRLGEQLAARPELLSVLVNIQWQLLQTVFDALLSLSIGIWVARSLGPERYGTMNYVVAFVALGSPFAALGLGALVVRNLVRDEAAAPTTLGTATFLRGVASLLHLLSSVAAIWLMRPGETMLCIYVAIMALGQGVRNLGIVDLWFQAKVQAQYLVAARVTATVLGSALKVAIILLHAPLIAFIAVASGEAAFTGVVLFVLYRQTTGTPFSSWRVNATVAKSLLSDGWPLIFSGLMSAVYMKLDQVMLGQMRGDADVGVYSVAVRLSESFYLVPNMVLISVFPSLVRARALGPKVYFDRFQRLYDAFVWAAIAAGVGVQLVGAFVIRHLYGAPYAASASVLAVHIWCGVFWYSGTAGHRYLISENHTKLTLAMTTAGALTNVVLNLVLIPSFGVLGAAYATLSSFAVSHCLSAAFTARSRPMLLFFMRSFDPVGLVRRWQPLLASAKRRT